MPNDLSVEGWIWRWEAVLCLFVRKRRDFVGRWHVFVHFYGTNILVLRDFTVHLNVTLKQRENSGTTGVAARNAGEKSQKYGRPG